MSGPLAGIRIVEIAGIGPGPFAAMVLSDLGAEVLRVDRAQAVSGGDPAQPPFDVLNRGRRSVGVDLKHPDGVATVLRLVERADALLEGFRPGVMERLGLGPDVCCARNPRLVYGRITGWGQEGPLAPPAGHERRRCRRSTWSATSAAAACSSPSASARRSSSVRRRGAGRWSTRPWSTARRCSWR